MADPTSVNAVKEIINSPVGFAAGAYLTLHIIDKAAFWIVKIKNRNGKAHIKCIDCDAVKATIEASKTTAATISRNEEYLKSMSTSSIEMVTILRGIEKNGKM